MITEHDFGGRARREGEREKWDQPARGRHVAARIRRTVRRDQAGRTIRDTARVSRYRTQIREVINRNTVVSLALDKSFNAVYDGGVDFILYRGSDGCVRKVQLKGRRLFSRDRRRRRLWRARLPDAGDRARCR